eukprot:627117-Prymnesium_polylepis.1
MKRAQVGSLRCGHVATHIQFRGCGRLGEHCRLSGLSEAGLATGDAIITAKESGAIGDAGAGTGVSKIMAESAGEAPQCQMLQQQQQQAQ